MPETLTISPETGTPRPDYARRVDELGRIVEQYNQITEKLQKSHDQLTQTVLSLRKELGEKNKQLERKNRLAALGEMAAGMAHEIRNPLGGIQLYASLLAKDVADKKDSLELVRKISGGVKHLESLVSQVLHFTREIQINPQPIDLARVIAQALEYADPRFQQNNCACTVQGPASLMVTADPVLLGQSVLNLLLNAADALPGGGNITIRYAAADESNGARQFIICVTDTGPGIDPSILDRIFNPFFTTRDHGTGLGLSIVHRIIEAHEGTITAANIEGGGARFEIRV